jgi:hypothetical protein
MGKDTKRWEKMGKDGGCVEECCFHVMLQTRECSLTMRCPTYGGRGLCQICGLDFVSELAEGSVCALIV